MVSDGPTYDRRQGKKESKKMWISRKTTDPKNASMRSLEVFHIRGLTWRRKTQGGEVNTREGPWAIYAHSVSTCRIDGFRRVRYDLASFAPSSHGFSPALFFWSLILPLPVTLPLILSLLLSLAVPGCHFLRYTPLTLISSSFALQYCSFGLVASNSPQPSSY